MVLCNAGRRGVVRDVQNPRPLATDGDDRSIDVEIDQRRHPEITNRTLFHLTFLTGS